MLKQEKKGKVKTMSNLAHDLNSKENSIVQTGKPVDYFEFLEEIEGKCVRFYDTILETFESDETLKSLEELEFISTWHTERDRLLKSIGIYRILWTLKHEESIILDRQITEDNNINRLEACFEVSYDADYLGKQVTDKIDECCWNLFNRMAINIINSGYAANDTDNKYIKILKETRDFSIYLVYETNKTYKRIHLIATSKTCEDEGLDDIII